MIVNDESISYTLTLGKTENVFALSLGISIGSKESVVMISVMTEYP